MALHAIPVTEHSLDKIAEVNGGARPVVEEIRTIFLHNDDPDGHNDIMTEDEFLANYWYDWNVTDVSNSWTPVKKI